MDIPVNLPGMEGQNLALRLAGTFAGPKLMLNGQPVAKKDGLFQLRTNTGAPLDVKLKARFLDPIPNLQVSGRTIQLVPALAWVSISLDVDSDFARIHRGRNRRVLRRSRCHDQ